MSRLHVHLHVKDLAQSVRFYSRLFGEEPTRLEKAYAKWMLDDPKVNFAISQSGAPGVSHLGIQVDSEGELEVVSARAKDAAGTILIEKEARCCYAFGNKAWSEDPQGIRWETFHTIGALDGPGTGAAEVIRDDGAPAEIAAACGCVDKAAPQSACCG